MILCLADVVPADLLARLQDRLPAERFADGAATAGWHARLVKHNQQIPRLSAEAASALSAAAQTETDSLVLDAIRVARAM